MTDAAFPPATELPRLYRDRELPPVEASRAALGQISRHNPVVNAFCLVDEEAAIAAARDSENRYAKSHPLGGLDGVSASIKGPLSNRCRPTLRGSPAVGPRQAREEDAPETVRLGKITIPAYGWVTIAEAGEARQIRDRLGNLRPGEPRTLSG